ncbi:MAG: hypothetical protein C0524_18160 [Rhodobacter sp.]|nr:hypothetical protein [Rhodobacter sp.]
MEMLFRPLALLCAAAILASIFLPWFTTALGETLVPWNTIRILNVDQMQDAVRNAPPEVIVFLVSFALATIFLLLALIGQESKMLAFLTGAIPVGLVAWIVLSASNQVDLSGLPISSGDLSQMLAQATEVLGPGAWAWSGGAGILVLLGLLDPGRRRRA